MAPLFDQPGPKMGAEMGPFWDPPFPQFLKDSLRNWGKGGPILGPFLGPVLGPVWTQFRSISGTRKIRPGTGPARKCPPEFFSSRPLAGRPAETDNATTMKASKVFSRGAGPAGPPLKNAGAFPVPRKSREFSAGPAGRGGRQASGGSPPPY